jgi:hypothetical protein
MANALWTDAGGEVIAGTVTKAADFLVAAGRQQRKPGGRPDHEAPGSGRNVKAHRRPGLQNVDILREDSATRGDDAVSPVFWDSSSSILIRLPFLTGPLSSQVPSKVTRGEGRKLRLS